MIRVRLKGTETYIRRANPHLHIHSDKAIELHKSVMGKEKYSNTVSIDKAKTWESLYELIHGSRGLKYIWIIRDGDKPTFSKWEVVEFDGEKEELYSIEELIEDHLEEMYEYQENWYPGKKIKVKSKVYSL